MNRNRLVIFAFVTIAVVIAAVAVNRQRAPTTTLEKQHLFPALAEKVNDVHSLELSRHNEKLLITRRGGQWHIQQADGYPADFSRIRETVIAVADLLVLSEKTSNPELYERLGVEDPAREDADSVLLTLLDASEAPLVSLIVGRQRRSKSPQDTPGLYVRLPGESTTLLVEGRIDASVQVKDWFDRDLFSIDGDRVKNIHIVHPDGESLRLQRVEKAGDLVLTDIPENMEMQSSVVVSRMGTLLEDVFVDDVVKAEKAADGAQTIATVQTFDGRVATINSATLGGTGYSRFHFSAAETPSAGDDGNGEDDAGAADDDSGEKKPDPAAEADALNDRLSGWAYAIPAFKFELFTRRPADLLTEKSGDDAGDKKNGPSVSE